MHIAEGRGDPFVTPMNRLQYVLRGMKRREAEHGSGGRERLPISPHILRQMKRAWEAKGPNPDTTMLWAAACLGFFGFLRAGEFTVPSDQGYDPKAHLSRGDIAVDNPTNPTLLRVTLKQSKTDPFRRGVNLFIGKTANDLCPVTAVLNHLIQTPAKEGPLFRFQDGRFLTRQRLVGAVREALEAAGVDQSKYSGHSFRIGAATTAAARGMEDSIIKTLGRWRSLAYLEYVKIPRNQLASYSMTLAA